MAQGWRIVPGSVRGTEDLVAGRFEPMMEFTVITDDRTENKFRIPTAQYNAETVRATVEEWYSRHIMVMDI